VDAARNRSGFPQFSQCGPLAATKIRVLAALKIGEASVEQTRFEQRGRFGVR